jgi:OPA family glycerol-3-phosphate transporter-like MFS transporter
MPAWIENFLPVGVLLLVIAVVVSRLPRVDLGHSKAFVRRRFFNWFPLGLTYALLYFGRYNLAEAKSVHLITSAEFGHIKMVGAWVYGISFLLNGPLTDLLGGRRTILLSAAGAAVSNIAMGLLVLYGVRENLVAYLAVLYGINMYFQSFGAVSIVKVNAHWFHLRERGMIGGVFGILISLGLYFAYDWSKLISHALPVQYIFFIPAATLVLFFIIDYFLVKDRPSAAGYDDFETGDATWDIAAGIKNANVFDTLIDALKRTGAVGRKMLTNPIILSIAIIEFCSGFLRGALMDGYKFYAEQTHAGGIIYQHWGLTQCIAGILGGVVAGVLSDRLFQSRRGPMSALLYGVIVLGSAAGLILLGNPVFAFVATLMMLSIIGVHGMLSGTASMDFGGKENAGIAVGIIDGFVYLGVGLQAFTIQYVLPAEGAASQDPSNWRLWPASMLVFALLGLVLAARLWNAKPNGNANSAH